MKVFLYALSTCPWCRKTKKFFQENKIPFDFVDYDLQSEEKQEHIIVEMTKLGGGSGFPLVVIGKEVIVGYNPQRFAQILGLKKETV